MRRPEGVNNKRDILDEQLITSVWGIISRILSSVHKMTFTTFTIIIIISMTLLLSSVSKSFGMNCVDNFVQLID